MILLAQCKKRLVIAGCIGIVVFLIVIVTVVARLLAPKSSQTDVIDFMARMGYCQTNANCGSSAFCAPFSQEGNGTLCVPKELTDADTQARVHEVICRKGSARRDAQKEGIL